MEEVAKGEGKQMRLRGGRPVRMARQTGRARCRRVVALAETHTDRRRDRQTDRQTERDRQTDRQTGRQVVRVTEIPRQTERKSHRQHYSSLKYTSAATNPLCRFTMLKTLTHQKSHH